MEFSYRLLANAVDDLSQLQGKGKRTMLRLALSLLDHPKKQYDALAGLLTEIKKYIIIYGNCQIISPIDCTYLSQLTLGSLIKKIENDQVNKLIFALNAIVKGETTNFYIYNTLRNSMVKFKRIVCGIPVSDDFEFAIQFIIGKSITQEVAFKNSLKRD